MTSCLKFLHSLIWRRLIPIWGCRVKHARRVDQPESALVAVGVGLGATGSAGKLAKASSQVPVVEALLVPGGAILEEIRVFDRVQHLVEPWQRVALHAVQRVQPKLHQAAVGDVADVFLDPRAVSPSTAPASKARSMKASSWLTMVAQVI